MPRPKLALEICNIPIAYRTICDAAPYVDQKYYIDQWLNKYGRENKYPHHALFDARVLKLAWDKVM